MLRETVMLNAVDLSKTLRQEEYEKLLGENQLALSALVSQIYLRQRPVIVIIEGWDAAGKGEMIRRVTENIDPRGYMVHALASPMGEEIDKLPENTAHHYLWQFWRLLPETGQIALFESSWYQRVLTERVEGFCSEDEWKRAFREINQFERQLVDFGTILLKFWIHISLEEQMRRFETPLEDKPHVWRLSQDDWRDQEKRDLYETAVDEMLLKTNTILAPWTVVAGDSRNYAQIVILQTLVKELSQSLDYDALNINDQNSGSKKSKKSKKKSKKKS
jgi:AMP-polyphosphate phosphotransferase